MYSVVNRGNGAAAASAEGHISLVSGWQGDVVPTADQPDDSGAARQEPGRQQHHRTARHPHPRSERHHRAR